MANRNDRAEGDLGLAELVRVLLEYKFVLAGTTVACVLVALFIALTSTPIYRAEVQAIAAEDRGGDNPLTALMAGVPNIAGLRSIANGSGGNVAEAIATLKSRQFTSEFIGDNDLLPTLFADKWNKELGEWDVESEAQVPSLADGYALFNEDVRSVIQDDDGIVKLVIEWSDPVMAADWANALIEKLNRRMRTKAIEEADRTIAFLEQELKKTNVVELRQAIYTMMENQLNTRTVASVRNEYAFKVVSPALPAEPDRFVRPRRMFIVILGGIAGVSFGVFLCFFLYGAKRLRADLA